MGKTFFFKICLMSFFSVFMYGLCSAANKTEGETKEKQNPPVSGEKQSSVRIKPVFTASSIDKVIKDFTDKVKSDNKKGDRSITPAEFMMFGIMMEKFYKYPDVELETQVYRAWYKKLFDSTSGMCNARRYENAAAAINQKDKTEKFKEDYKKYFNDFKNLIINKKKYQIPDDKLKELQKKKEKAEEEAAKKKRRR